MFYTHINYYFIFPTVNYTYLHNKIGSLKPLLCVIIDTLTFSNRQFVIEQKCLKYNY